MSKSYQDQVVIVGGGIAGLALARTLSSANVPYSLLERRGMPANQGLAFNLPGNAIQALATLGLRDRIEAMGHPIGRREYRTAGDKLLFEIDEDAFWGNANRPRSVRRSDLLTMLADGIDQSRLLHGVELRSVAATDAGGELKLNDGRVVTGTLVVGADGVRSTVRREIFGAAAGAGHAVLADASWRFMAPNPGIDCWTVWASAEGMILLMPVSHGEVYCWAAITKPKGGSESNIGALMAMSWRFPRRVRDAVLHVAARPAALHHSPLEEVRMNRWHAQRVVLIGDAAHATAPVWAQGVALGLEDAIVLGRSVEQTADIPAALAEYEASRRSRVAHVQHQTDAMSKAAKLPVALRNLLLPIVGPKSYRQTYTRLKEGV